MNIIHMKIKKDDKFTNILVHRKNQNNFWQKYKVYLKKKLKKQKTKTFPLW